MNLKTVVIDVLDAKFKNHSDRYCWHKKKENGERMK